MITYDSASDLARMLGVSRAAVSNWLRRYTTYPEPDAIIGGDYGWLPSKRVDWHAWYFADWEEKALGTYNRRSLVGTRGIEPLLTLGVNQPLSR